MRHSATRSARIVAVQIAGPSRSGSVAQMDRPVAISVAPLTVTPDQQLR
jgi:hypothetical protein